MRDTKLLGSYDAAATSLVVNQVAVIGFQDNQKVSWTRANATNAVHVDLDGNGVKTHINNNTGSVTVPLSQMSPNYKQFTDLANSGETCSIIYESDSEIVHSEDATVEKPADGTGESTSSVRQFVFQCVNLHVEPKSLS